MPINLSENRKDFDELINHVGHKLRCAYNGYVEPVNVSIECETCKCILIDFVKPEIIKMPFGG